VSEAHTVDNRLNDRNDAQGNPHRLDGVASSKLPDADEVPSAARRRTGRPRSGEGPIIPWSEIDRLLIFGEAIQDPRTGREMVKFPSIAVLAKRYGCSRTLIWRYANRAKCYARREEAKLKTQETYERKVIEKLANTQAQATTDVTVLVDDYIDKFSRALKEGKVRTDSPADLDRLVRLKELLSGHADSRSELQGQLTLAAIQQRHGRLRGQLDGMTPELAGTSAENSGDELVGKTRQVLVEDDAQGGLAQEERGDGQDQ
jgi:hypothetical protein